MRVFGCMYADECDSLDISDTRLRGLIRIIIRSVVLRSVRIDDASASHVGGSALALALRGDCSFGSAAHC